MFNWIPTVPPPSRVVRGANQCAQRVPEPFWRQWLHRMSAAEKRTDSTRSMVMIPSIEV
eukprot:CAMPEP_0182526820 /NCGR_PEP_ID=MMETSP1323-20130603/3466_1 /TAXON_ID=236787 /ORGANISM="Florenciella parvula, Strain RCC1693" /LENGTH=58 /DNA_ID=CAMNT_0024735741 /DNA_START=176 /DNA_END=355 /DNA_ORIENTATION=+